MPLAADKRALHSLARRVQALDNLAQKARQLKGSVEALRVEVQIIDPASRFHA